MNRGVSNLTDSWEPIYRADLVAASGERDQRSAAEFQWSVCSVWSVA